MDGQGAFQLKWQLEHQKLYALDRHESSTVAPVPLFEAKVNVLCRITNTVVFGLYLFKEATPTGFVARCYATASCSLNIHRSWMSILKIASSHATFLFRGFR